MTAICSQFRGRYWLAQYLTQFSHQFTGDMHEHLAGIGDLYMKVYAAIKRFVEFNIADGKDEAEIQGAIDWLEEAYQADEQILDEFISLRKA